MRRGTVRFPTLALLLLIAPATASAQVVINEIDYDQPGTDAAEFVEIYNAGGAPVDLTDHTLELVNGTGGGAAVYQTYSLAGFVLAPGDYLVVCGNAATVANCDLDVSPDTNLIQNGAPDAVGLRSGGILIDAVSYEGDTGAPYTEGSGLGLIDPGATATDSIGRCPDGFDTQVNNVDLQALATHSPGATNGCGDPPRVVINEIDYDQPGTDVAEFVELYNAGGAPADLTDYTLELVNGNGGGAVVYQTYSLAGFVLAPGDYLVVCGDAATVSNCDLDVSPDTNLIQNGAPDAVGLRSNGTLVDAVSYEGDTGAPYTEGSGVGLIDPASTATDSIGRCPDGVDTQLNNVDLQALANHSPGATNGCGGGELTAIHDIQGSGAASPLVGQVVTTRGIVTAKRSNAFFLQAPDAQADGDPATSEGIVVFTSSAPTVAVGDEAQVTGTVAEFVPSADPQQPPITELGNPSLAVAVLSSGNPLPAPVALTASLPDPSGVFDQLERLEGMRVSVASLTVVSPTLGSINESQATATTNGVFYGVVTGVARPFREAGVQLPDALPAGSPANVPRFDTNPETLRVDSDGQVPPPSWAPLDVAVGGTVAGLVGVLDYSFRTYTILPDPVAAATASGAPIAPATAPGPGELTVASFNLHRLFDTVDDPAIGDPVLTAAAFDRRLGKISLAVRDFLHLPDVVAVQEVENLATLEALAARISSDATGGGLPDPEYVAHLVEGNDPGGIDVGFLVRGSAVPGSPAVGRIEGVTVTQIGALEELIDPDPGQPNALLNDRPPLVLEAVANFPTGDSLPFTVIVVHQRSLGGIASEDPEGTCCGWATVGQRVRAKRLQQALYLAGEIQSRQTSTVPEERNVAVVGDFNAFEFNDGFVDVLGTVTGAPAPDDETVVPGDGTSPVVPALQPLEDVVGERYSYTFDGDAQQLDQALVTSALAGAAPAVVDHARIDADFPVVSRQLDGSAEYASDHDPLLVRLTPADWSPDEVFRGDFESGDTRWWSVTVP